MTRSLRIGVVRACFAIVCVACSAPSDPPGSVTRIRPPQSHIDIVGGSASPASQDATVMISIGANDLCTGTLIAPNLVLTARHCITKVTEDSECGTFTTEVAAATMKISLGAGALPAAFVASGTKTFSDGNPSGCSHDIGLILLDKQIPGAHVATLRMGQVPVGEITIAVGYGESGAGQLTPAREQRAGLAVLAIGPQSFTFTPQTGPAIPVTVSTGEIVTGESTCFGDSGGPLFDTEGRIVGLTSRGVDDKCVDRPSIYSDVASHMDLIANALNEAGFPLIPAEGGDAGSPPLDGGSATEAPGNGGRDAGKSSSGPTGAEQGGPASPKKSGANLLGASASAQGSCSTSPGRESSRSGLAAWMLAAVAFFAARRRRSA